MKTFSLIGERCSGTNWVQLLITRNFEITETRYPGFKHWPDYCKPRPKNHITIYLIRNAVDWLGSFYKSPHYVKKTRAQSMYAFMYTIPFVSMRSLTEEVKQDKNLETNQPYKNLWDMRASKHSYWLKRSENFQFYSPTSYSNSSTIASTTAKNMTSTTSSVSQDSTVDLWVRYEDILADPQQFLNFMSKRFSLKHQMDDDRYDILPHTYKTRIDIKFNQLVHKDKQLFNNPVEAAIWVKKVMAKQFGVLVLTALIESEIEKKMGYDIFYKDVLKELNGLSLTQPEPAPQPNPEEIHPQL